MEGEIVLDRMDDEIETEASAELLVMELGESYSDEDAERVLAEYEALHGRAYKRPSEAIGAFQKRAKGGVASPKTRGDDLGMDRASATELLRQLRNMPLPDDAEQAKAHKARVHKIEVALGVAKTDFAKPRPSSADAANESKRRFIAIEFEKVDESAEKAHILRHVDDRLALVQTETDLGALHLILANDKDASVIAAAEQRLGQLELDTEVLAAQIQRTGRAPKG